MKYGIEIGGRLFEEVSKEKLVERLEVIRTFYKGFTDPSYLTEYVKPVKIYANGERIVLTSSVNRTKVKKVVELLK